MVFVFYFLGVVMGLVLVDGVAVFGLGEVGQVDPVGRVERGVVSRKVVVHEGVGVGGDSGAVKVKVKDQGLAVSGRELSHRGRVMAADLKGFRERVAEMEALVDGGLHRLTDETGRVWEDVMVLEVLVGLMERVGPGVGAGFLVKYLVVGGEG